MFDTTLREYIRFNGMGSGESDRTAVFTRYQLSVEKSERLTSTWTLEQYERCYERAFYNIVKAANPDWKPGQRFDPSLLDGVTRQSVEQQIVPLGWPDPDSHQRGRHRCKSVRSSLQRQRPLLGAFMRSVQHFTLYAPYQTE